MRESGQRPPRLLVVTDITPRSGAGGEMVLYRHLKNLCRWELGLVLGNLRETELAPFLIHRATELWPVSSRIGKRFPTWSRLAWALGLGTQQERFVFRLLDEYCPDVVLTVAHGPLFWTAARWAKKRALPLVVIHHDWLPDRELLPKRWTKLVEYQFRKVIRFASVNLCVSTGMRELLGPGVESKLLHPIPGSPDCCESRRDHPAQRLTLFYLGNLWGSYGELVRGMAEQLGAGSHLRMRVAGQLPPDWDEAPASGTVEWLGYVPRSELLALRETVQLGLVVLSFDPEERRLMETNFPSKLIEYLGLGLPVLVWGPEYAAGAKFAQTSEACHWVGDPNPAAVLAVANRFLQESQTLRKMEEAVDMEYKKHFAPARLQRVFTEALKSVLDAKASLAAQ